MIEIDHVEYVHATGVPALRGVHVTLEPGRWTALIGPNGSGKTTLARCLNGLLVPTAGAVRVDGVLNDRHHVDQGWTAEIALPWSGMKLLDDKEVLPPRSGTELRVELGRTEVVEGPGSSATALWTWAHHGSSALHIPECYPVITLSGE